MVYHLVSANETDMVYLKEAKLYNIFKYASGLEKEEVLRIKKYIDEHIPLEISGYKMVICDGKKIGCCFVCDKDDGVILDEIFIEEGYRNKGIGSDIIKKILENNEIVYLWVYKENFKAIRLYKKLGFGIIEETKTRYYMKYIKQ